MTTLTTGLAAALALGQFGGFISRIGEAALERQLAQMKAAGEALTLEELVARRPAVPDDQNSALVILALQDELEEVGNIGIDLPYYMFRNGPKTNLAARFPWTQADIEEARTLVRGQLALLEQLDRLHSMPNGRYPFDRRRYLEGDLVFTQSRNARQAARLESIAALVDVADARTPDALRRVTIMFNVGSPLYEEPSLLAALAAMSCDALAVDVLQVILDAGPVDAAELKAIEAVLLDHARRGDLSWGMRAERLSLRAIIETFAQPGVPFTIAAPPAPSIPGVICESLKALNIAKALEMQGKLVDALDDPAELRLVAAQVEDDTTQLPPQYLLIRILFPSQERAIALNMRARGVLGSARAALAAERYRMAHGDWPASLDALVPDYLDAVPLDLFDGQPLRMRRTEEGVVIYSIGEDNVDDGGDLFAKEGDRPKDAGFRLLDPARRGIMIVEGEAVSATE